MSKIIRNCIKYIRSRLNQIERRSVSPNRNKTLHINTNNFRYKKSIVINYIGNENVENWHHKPIHYTSDEENLVKKLKTLNKPIDEQIILLASEYISPYGSKLLFRSLGLHDATIDQLEKDNLILQGSREVVYKTLLGWKHGSEKTIGELVTALDKNKNIECLKELIRQFRKDGTLEQN